MTIASDGLKRCPFCGGIAIIAQQKSRMYKVGCANLGCLVQAYAESFFADSAIEAWNAPRALERKQWDNSKTTSWGSRLRRSWRLYNVVKIRKKRK